MTHALESQRLVDTFIELARIPSESGEEELFLDWLGRTFANEFGANCHLDTYGNLVCKIAAKNSPNASPILLCAHGDTVSPGKDIQPQIEHGTITSAGETILAADDKAGIAEIMEALRRADTHPPVEVVVTRQEEVGLLGSKNLETDSLEATTGFVVDGFELDTIVTGWPSCIALDIHVVGETAHPGIEPEKGISAIRVAAKAIAALREGRVEKDTTVSFGTFRGGQVRNAVPKEVVIEAECRSLDHDRALQQAEKIRRKFQSEAGKAGASVEVQARVDYKAAHIPSNHRAVQLAKTALTSVGLSPVVSSSMGGADAVNLNAKGIFSVVLGYGGRNVHSTNETIEIAAMEKATEIIHSILMLSARAETRSA